MTTRLEKCAICGRLGWHPTDRCPAGFPDLWPAPPDAVSVGDWEVADGPDDIRRTFYGTTRGDRVPVEIVGWQKLDGTIGRGIIPDLRGVGGELDAPTARQMARDLLAAADEIVGLN
ncbi:hypothetical protein [Mycolicibacterium moriokaense]|uniref:Uncharacterized protein n=1 Tax=Mycolicibacterium moriokaense TaxID=39691 RepID=A0AAD1HCD5_9MYCO|nr:hypothetical protein [Mycolicibacterium moriokaense]MCV7039702.1 hypothetical protein [Mycolicibacterium moriokaense]BBX01851.1 hypothetical protein MMOR_27870 [Mycolicibacterium moriokaense]